jgi:hypothetical protein
MTNLNEMIVAAIARQAANGITGWGLNNPDPALFTSHDVGEAVGCDSDTCNHNSHDAAAPSVKLIPVRGTLIDLGTEGHDNWTTYYTLIDGDNVIAHIEVSGDRAYHDRARIVANVPDWCLTAMAR